jgi:hypothetical protein
MVNPRDEGPEKGIFRAWKEVLSHVLMTSLNVLIYTLICRYSVLPALSLNDAILHVEVVEGSFNSDLFKEFIDALLPKMQPFPGPNSVIVMDNCRIHKHADVLAAIEER